MDENGHIFFNEDIDQIILDVDEATIIGQITSEMLSNASKHAFPDDRSGTVTISLKKLDGEDVELIIADDGIGLPEGFSLALQHHEVGELSKAEGIYQQILQADPNQPVALHLLGVIAHQVGKHDTAVDLIMKA